MSKASALAAATGQPAPVATPTTGGLVVSPRQAARVPVTTAATPTPGPVAVVVPTAPAVETPKDGVDSERFAHLAKKEAAIQKDREALKAEREAIAAAKAKYDEVEKTYRNFEEMKTKDPIQAMKLAGFSDTDIFNFYAKAQEDAKLKDTPEAKAADSAAKAAKAVVDEFEKKQSDAQAVAKAKTDAAVINRFKGSISQTITSNKDKYEFCNFHGPAAEVLIYETVEACFKEDRKDNPNALPISAQEAADLVEKYYEDQDKAQAALKKRGGQVAPAPVEEKVANQTTSRTLTNKVGPTVISTIPKKETREEKRERLINNIKEHGLKAR
jgi:hypothetical protein